MEGTRASSAVRLRREDTSAGAISRPPSPIMAAVQPNQGMPQQQQQQTQGNAVVNQVLPPGMTGDQVKAMFQVRDDMVVYSCMEGY